MKRERVVYPIISAVILIILWEFLPKILNVKSYIFPRFSEIITSIFLQNSEWFFYLSVTAKEALLGFLIGSLFGFLIGLLMAESRIIGLVTLPYLVASNAIPVIAIAPIVILWFGNGIMSKIAISAFLCFFPLSINTYKGLSNYPTSYMELFKVYGSSSTSFLLKFKLKNALPFIYTGLKLNATSAVIGSVVGEIIASDSGLGFGMLQGVYSLNMPRVWGYVGLSCFLGVFFYFIIYMFEKINLTKFRK